MTTKPKPMTFEEASKRAGVGPSLKEIRANYDQIVKEVEAELGPHVPTRLHGRGRPRKGSTVAPTRTHSLRIADSTWEAVSESAKKDGISVNQAAQIALIEWAGKRRTG